MSEEQAVPAAGAPAAEESKPELEGKIGSVGTYSVDVTSKGIVKATVGVEVDLVAELEKLALKSDNKIDDAIVNMVKAALGR